MLADAEALFVGECSGRRGCRARWRLSLCARGGERRGVDAAASENRWLGHNKKGRLMVGAAAP